MSRNGARRRRSSCVVFTAALLVSVPAHAAFLRFAGSLTAAAGPYPLTGAHGVAVSPDGRDVYAVSFDDNALVVLGRNTNTGAVTFSQAAVDGRNGVLGLFRAVAVTVSPDGKDVYVASFFGDALAAFRRDPASGALSYVTALFGGATGSVGLTQLQGVAVSPDGRHIYVTSFGDNAVSLVRRDTESGEIHFVEALIDGQEGVEGIFRPSGVAVSADGGNAYVLGGGSNSLAVFARDSDSGHLTFLEAHVDGEGGVAGLEDGVSLALSADDHDVYALGANGLAHFQRAAEGGNLVFAGVQSAGVLNDMGTSGPTGVAVSPDGLHVYVARDGDDTLGVLQRNLADGSLAFVEERRDGTDGIEGLAGATTVAVSPDSTSVYVAAQFGDAIATFRTIAPSCVGECDGDGEVTIDELVRAVGIALGEQNLLACAAGDRDGDGAITVDEIVTGVNNALQGCDLV